MVRKGENYEKKNFISCFSSNNGNYSFTFKVKFIKHNRRNCRSTCTVSKLEKRNAKNGLVELTFEVFNHNGELVLTDATEMIIKCKPLD